MSNERNERGRFVERVALDDVRGVLAKANEPVTAREIADEFGVTPRAALNKLNELHERGAVKRKKVGGRSVVWWLADAEDTAVGGDSGKDESAFARRLSRKAIAEQYGDDYFGRNPGWADDLEDLGENA